MSKAHIKNKTIQMYIKNKFGELIIIMKLPVLSATVLSLAVASTFAQADSRFTFKMENSKKTIIKELARKMGGELKVDANGFITAKFSGRDLSQIKAFFKDHRNLQIEEDPKRFPLAVYSDDPGDPNAQQITPYSYYQSQADQVSFDPNAGVKVCVIDSGLDRSNQDFNWNNITGDNNSGTGSWDSAGGPHGTHVAGTIAAEDNGIGVVGMAPGVDMHIIKVFNEDGWGYSSDLAFAAQKCKAAGATIITMSLGGGEPNTAEENAFDDFTTDGGLVLAAAGNDGNDTRSFPAGYASVMMVGGNDANNDKYDASQFPACTNSSNTDCVEISAGGLNVLSAYPAGEALLAKLDLDGNTFDSSAMENGGTVSANTYYMGTAEATDSGAAGKVCVIDRGAISFHDKVKNCETSGGKGAIIINNTAGMLNATLGDTNTTTIPAVGAAYEDRAAILAAANASISLLNSDYGYMSGTSMATPAVAGVAALVWSNHPLCTGSQIRAALNASAEDAGDAGRDVDFGHGIVKAKAANDHLIENGCDVIENKLVNGVTLTNLTAAKNGEVFYTLEVPANASNLTIATSGGSGDADLHVRYGAPVSTSDWDYRPYQGGNNETVSIANPQAGTYYVMAHAWEAFSGLSLVASFDVSGPTDTYSSTSAVAIPDNSPQGATSIITVPRSGDAGSVTVDLNITHTYIGDLTVKLTSPSGTSETIWSTDSSNSSNNIVESISANFAGATSNGNWTLTVVDSARRDTGTINNWSITFN